MPLWLHTSVSQARTRAEEDLKTANALYEQKRHTRDSLVVKRDACQKEVDTLHGTLRQLEEHNDQLKDSIAGTVPILSCCPNQFWCPY